ncbi:MAG TPA: ATPase, partial [Nautiliaceae bacterium]|nr:ATPase [Nautiliaceae bacterium]
MISSTTWFVKELLSKNSPLLALFNQVLISLIDEEEILKKLSKK